MDCVENELIALCVYYWSWTMCAHIQKGKVWTKHDWMTRSCLVTKKKWYEPQTMQTSRVCYRLLCTDLVDGISCILSLSHNIHGVKWCLSAMDKMSFEVKICFGNAFSRDLETQMLKFPPSVPIMPTLI